MTDLERLAIEDGLRTMARVIAEQRGFSSLDTQRALAAAALTMLARDHGAEEAADLMRRLLEIAEAGPEVARLREAEVEGRA